MAQKDDETVATSPLETLRRKVLEGSIDLDDLKVRKIALQNADEGRTESNRRPSATVVLVLGIGGVVAFLTAIAAYAFYFRDWYVVADPERWGQFGDYLAGAAGPLIAFLAFIALLWTIVQNERELRLSREALQQNNRISSGRAKRELLEAQKADIHRIILPLTSEIESSLDGPLSVPSTINVGASSIHLGGQYVVRDLFKETAVSNHRKAIVPKNEERLSGIGEQVADLERYLRAYERLADDAFFTSYYKQKYEGLVAMLHRYELLPSEDQQAVIDFFQPGEDILTSAERSIVGALSASGSISISGSANLTGSLETLLIREAKSEARQLPYVSVYTYPKPNDPTVRLVNISWAYSTAPSGGVPPNSDAVEAAPMSHDEAVRRGKGIASKYGFPILYWQKDPDPH